MKMIKQIFFSDIKSLTGNFFVLAIALGLCMLPALYAWFNIYSNWDPYGNTGNVRIAAASADKGFTDNNGNTVNAGEQVMKSLKESDSIEWVFTSTENARKKVDSGDCYAAVVLPETFSSYMYDGLRQGLKRPEISYYVNEKKNAVATKITDTAVATLQNSLNEMYISTLVSNLFSKEASVADAIQEEQIVTRLQERIQTASDTIAGYSRTVDSMQQANTKLSSTLDTANTELQTADSQLKGAKSKLTDDESFLENILAHNRRASSAMHAASLSISRAMQTSNEKKKTKLYKKAIKQLDKAAGELNKISAVLKPLNLTQRIKQQTVSVLSKITAQVNTVQSLRTRIKEKTKDDISNLTEAAENALSRQMEQALSTFDTTLLPLIEEVAGLIDTAKKDTANAITNMREDIELLSEILTGTSQGLGTADKGLTSLSQSLSQMSKRLESLNDSLDTIADSELVTRISSFLQKEPERYGAFFSSPINIKSERVYPVKNYGTGVTPFYTTLAIWVGGIFLVSLLKVKPDASKFPGAKPHELFLGRFLLFFVLGQLQTLIVVIGNLCLLHTQCNLPKHFWLAAALASFTFSLLIYTLTVSFGDIGKALVVVIVVIQIAGSSGTFPIEILPEFYQRVYVFFPFPYAINAMREAICGMNSNDYVIYLLQLLLFAAGALLVGLVIRLPFRGLNHFVEERMEDTGIM